MAKAQIDGKELMAVRVQGVPTTLLVLRKAESVSISGVLPLIDGFNHEHGVNLRLPSPNAADRAVFFLTNQMSEAGLFPVGQLVAYERPRAELRSDIAFYAGDDSRLSFAIGHLQREVQTAIRALQDAQFEAGFSFAAHDDSPRKTNVVGFVVLDPRSSDFVPNSIGAQLTLAPERVIILSDLPPYRRGTFCLDDKTAFPHGRDLLGNDNPSYESMARVLVKLDDAPFVGFVTRFVRSDYRGQNVVRACDDYVSTQVGVVVEVPREDVAKIEQLLK